MTTITRHYRSPRSHSGDEFNGVPWAFFRRGKGKSVPVISLDPDRRRPNWAVSSNSKGRYDCFTRSTGTESRF